MPLMPAAKPTDAWLRDGTKGDSVMLMVRHEGADKPFRYYATSFITARQSGEGYRRARGLRMRDHEAVPCVRTDLHGVARGGCRP